MKRKTKIMKNTIWSLLGLALIFNVTSCKEDDPVEEPTPETAQLTMSVNGLEDVGSDYAYEGWIIVNGAPVSTGLFTVDANGVPSATQFTVAKSDLDAASTYVLTIEPSPDTDPAPSHVHILGGDFGDSSADISVGHAAALGNDFTAISGEYIFATPTDGPDNNELSGVWFLDPSGPSATLDLPALPAQGWAYEGWAVINGVPVSTGTFTDATVADNLAPYSGTEDAPPFPGEDFLFNAPSGLSFPTDLSESTIVISIEPVPDNSPAPFTLKPLAAAAPAGAAHHTLYDLDSNLGSFPSGSVSR